MNNDSTLAPSPSLGRRLRARHEKTDHLDSFLQTLDAIIFLQIGIIYLCDNLTFLLVLRAVSQVVHVQYRPQGATQLTPAIFVNVLCSITHLLQHGSDTKPLHGGLIIDFVGELAPSRWRLLFLDLVVLGLQLLMLVAGYEKQVASGDAQPLEEPRQQDIEAEEEGRLGTRVQEQPTETAEGIELQSLLAEADRPEDPRPSHKEPSEGAQDDDMIVLDMRKGLKYLLRRPLPSLSPTVEDPATRAGLANVLARIAAARAGAS